MRTPICTWLVQHARVGVLFLLACNAPPYPEQESQDEAVEIVWRGTYAMGGKSPPRIEWKLPETLDCGDGVAFTVKIPTTDASGKRVLKDRCVYGIYWPTLHKAQVAWPEGANYSSTAFAHELWHAAMAWKRLPDDATHISAGFQPGGEVDQANATLRARGL